MRAGRPTPHTLTNLLPGLAAAMLAVPLAAHAYLGAFSRYMADDYCYSAIAQSLGWWGAQRHWYTLWSGRFSFTAIVSASALAGPATAQLFPGLTVLAWLLALTWLAALLRPAAPRWGPPLLALSVLYASLTAIPNVAQSLYWRNSLLTYTLPLVLLTAGAGLLVWAARHARERSPWVWGLALASLAFFTAGFSEVSASMQGALLAAAGAAAALMLRGPARRRWLILLGGALLGTVAGVLVNALSPGTGNRQATFAPPPGWPQAARAAIEYSLWFLRDTARGWPLAWLLAALVPAALALMQRAAPLPPRRLAAGLLALPLVVFCLLAACYAPAFYSLLTLPPERVLIVPAFVLMAGTAAWGTLAGLALAQTVPAHNRRLAAGLAATALVLLCVPALAEAGRVLAGLPAARAFARTWDSYDLRLRAARANGEAEATLASLTSPGAVEPLTADPNHWSNRCAADYYGLAVKALPAPPAAPAAELAARQPLDADIGGVARLLGYQAAPASVRPGDTLTVTVYWSPAAHTDVPQTVFVHLYQPERGTLAQADRYPGQGRYPTTWWILEQPFADTFTLEVPADAAPGGPPATLLLGLYDVESLARLPVSGADAAPDGQAWVQFGQISLQP